MIFEETEHGKETQMRQSHNKKKVVAIRTLQPLQCEICCSGGANVECGTMHCGSANIAAMPHNCQCLMHCAAATYSDSAVDNVTNVFSFVAQLTTLPKSL